MKTFQRNTQIELIPIENGIYNEKQIKKFDVTLTLNKVSDRHRSYYDKNIELVYESDIIKKILRYYKVRVNIAHLRNGKIYEGVTIHFSETCWCFCSHGPYNLYLNLSDRRADPYRVWPFYYDRHIIVTFIRESPKDFIRPTLDLSNKINIPLIFLDVDGVVNFSEGNNEVGQKNKYEKPSDLVTVKCCSSSIKQWDVSYSPSIVNKINEWSNVAEIRWLTSWDVHARHKLAPLLGFKDFGVSTLNKHHLHELPKEDRERVIIWIDDELGTDYLKNPLAGLELAAEDVYTISPKGILSIKNCEDVGDILRDLGLI